MIMINYVELLELHLFIYFSLLLIFGGQWQSMVNVTSISIFKLFRLLAIKSDLHNSFIEIQCCSRLHRKQTHFTLLSVMWLTDTAQRLVTIFLNFSLTAE